MMCLVRVCVGFAGAMVAACADDGEAAPQPAAETRDSRPGIVQVGDDEGPLLSETEACERFRTGWEEHRQRLNCTVPVLAACPDLIRPLASTVCVSYNEGSLEACLDRFAAADSCEEVVPGACVLTAVLGVWSPECVTAEDAGPRDAGPQDAGPQDASVMDATASEAPAGDAAAAPVMTSEGPALDAGETATSVPRSSAADAAAASTSPGSPSGTGASSEAAAASGPDVASGSGSAPRDAG